MKILFVQTNTYPLLYPLPVGPAMVVRRLQRDGHDVRFVDLMGEKDPPAAAGSAAQALGPDLACFSVRNRDNQSSLRYVDPVPGIRAVVDAVRRVSAAPTLLGGTAFTTFPSRMLAALDADYGIAGDDLEQVARFVRSVASGRPDVATPGLVYRGKEGSIIENPFAIVGYRDATFDHHGVADPRRYRKGFWQSAVVTRTGCSEKCAYCDTFHTFGRDFVLREPADIAAEMLELKRTGKVRSIWFIDAGFNRPLDHAKGILREIIRAGAQLQLQCVLDPGPTDDEFCRLYRMAGGAMVTMFAESLADSVLRELDKSFGWEDILRASEELRRAGLGFFFMPTFGGPGETRDTVRQTLSRIPLIRPTYWDYGIGWRLQPRTPLRDRAVREGMILADDDCWEARFYVSPDTPRAWLERELRAHMRLHPFRMWPMVRFMVAHRGFRPWTWPAGEA